MSMNFPINPSVGDTYSLGTKTWMWNGTAWDLVPNAIAADTLLGNNTASIAAPVGLTAAQVKALLAIAAGDISGLATVASSGSYNDLLNKPTLGSLAALSAINNANWSGTDLVVANGGTGVSTLTGIVKGNGTSAFSAAVAGTDYVVPSGSITGNAATATILATSRTIGMSGVIATAQSFNGSASITIPVTAVPASLLTGTISSARSWALSGDVTSPAGSSTTTIASGAVTLAKMAALAASSLIGNSSASAATPAAITIGSGLSLAGGVLSASGGGGSGTVTNVSIVTANGISGTVANATTTPAITLSLGAITPSSVAATGTVTGSNLSGTNTGDQTTITGNAGTATKLATATTIGLSGVTATSQSFDGSAAITIPVTGVPTSLLTGVLAAGQIPALTGDVTNSTGSLATTISAGAVTLAKMANLAANSILGNNTGTATTPIALTATQVKALLAIAVGDVSGLGSAASLNSGTGAGNLPTVAEADARYAQLAATNIFSKAQVVSPIPNNTASGTITPDASASNNFEYTLIGDLTIANPTNITPGEVLNFALVQDATGSRTITLGANFVLRSGDAFSSAANAVDIMSCYCHTNGKIYASVRNN